VPRIVSVLHFSLQELQASILVEGPKDVQFELTLTVFLAGQRVVVSCFPPFRVTRAYREFMVLSSVQALHPPKNRMITEGPETISSDSIVSSEIIRRDTPAKGWFDS
jgi:hypothetical protein